MLGSALLILATILLALLVILVVLLAQTIVLRIKVVFAAVLLSLILWQVSIFVADHTQTHLLLLNHLVFLWPTIAAMSFLAFIILLRQSSHASLIHRTNKKNIVLGALTVFAFSLQVVAVSSGHIFDQVYYNSATMDYTFVRGMFYPIYLAGFVLMIIGVLLQLVISFTLSKHNLQQRAAFRVIILTVLITTAYGLVANVLLPLFTGSQKYITLGSIAVNIFAVGLALSIVRYQFLDIRTYVFRTVVYLITLLIAMLAYVGIAGIISSYLLADALSLGAIVTLSLITLVVATSFQPLKERFNRLTSQLFFREYYDSQEVLDQLGRLLVGTVDLEVIKNQSRLLLERSLKPLSIEYLLFSDKHKKNALMRQLERSELNIIITPQLQDDDHIALMNTLKKENIGLVVRLRTKHENLGFMLLGFRQSGASYSLADKRFIGVVADQLSLGLQNALRFQEIQEFNATLQQKVDEATKRLRRTNERLRTLDQTKDDFISMASHQLRTPLTSVKGYVSMVLDGDAGKITALQRKLLNQSFVSSQRMVYLISDLLNVSRLKTGKFLIEPVPTNLVKVIKDEVDQLQETAKGRNLQLTFHKPEHFPVLMLDETKMRQVIMNFIDNAIYYTPSGGRITVNLADKPESIEFTVVDNGIGVPRHERHHLFTKFFRAHNAKRARPDGTGLGLFMAKKVIIAQGGATIFKSQENKGSTFGFSFAKANIQNPDKAGEGV